MVHNTTVNRTACKLRLPVPSACGSGRPSRQMLGVMNRFALLVFIAASVVFSSQATAAPPCAKYADQLGYSFAPEECVCGKSLRNLDATLPPQMKIVAACGLRWPLGKMIDLTRQKVSLDRYSDGNLPFGYILLVGKVQLHGQLRYEPGNAGDFWFTPTPPLLPRQKAWSAELYTLKFIGDDLMAKFRVPANLRNTACTAAKATIAFNSIRVLIGETDEAGAYPIEYKVVRMSRFKSCGE